VGKGCVFNQYKEMKSVRSGFIPRDKSMRVHLLEVGAFGEPSSVFHTRVPNLSWSHILACCTGWLCLLNSVRFSEEGCNGTTSMSLFRPFLPRTLLCHVSDDNVPSSGEYGEEVAVCSHLTTTTSKMSVSKGKQKVPKYVDESDESDLEPFPQSYLDELLEKAKAAYKRPAEEEEEEEDILTLEKDGSEYDFHGLDGK